MVMGFRGVRTIAPVGAAARGAALVVLLLAGCSAPAQPRPKPGSSGAPPAAAPAASAPSGAASTVGAAPAPATGAGEQPRRGGELTFVVGAEPPSFDAHREATFAMIHPTAPHYSLLLKFDP